MSLTIAAKHEAFSQTEEGNDLQFSLPMEVLPSNNLKIGSTLEGSIKRDYRYCIQSLEATMYGCKNDFKQVQNRLVSCGQVLR